MSSQTHWSSIVLPKTNREKIWLGSTSCIYLFLPSCLISTVASRSYLRFIPLQQYKRTNLARKYTVLNHFFSSEHPTVQHLLHGIPQDTFHHFAFNVGLLSQNIQKTVGGIASRTICECDFRCGVNSSPVLSLKTESLRKLLGSNTWLFSGDYFALNISGSEVRTCLACAFLNVPFASKRYPKDTSEDSRDSSFALSLPIPASHFCPGQ